MSDSKVYWHNCGASFAGAGASGALEAHRLTCQAVLDYSNRDAERKRRMNPHLIDGKFQSDKCPYLPRGAVPLSCDDPIAQPLLWAYAQVRRAVDAEFADLLEEALRIAGYVPAASATALNAAYVRRAHDLSPTPIPLLLMCPACGKRHVDGLSTDGIDWATKPHHTHACQHCGMVWRPALVPTVGVRFLPGFKNEVSSERSNK